MRRCMAAMVLLVLCLRQASADPRSAPAAVPLGPDTTFLKSPLKPDGTIDYIAATDAIQKKGVTAENNMLVPLLRAVGTGDKVIDPRIREETLKRLGLSAEPGKRTFERDFTGKELEALQEEGFEATRAPWKASKFPRVAKWIAADEPAIALYVEASRRSRYYLPAVSKDGTMVGVMLPSLGAARGLSNLVTARAMMRLEAGDVDGCIADLSAVHRIGRLYRQGATLIEYLVGCAIDALASHGDAVLIASGKLTAKQAKDYLAAQDAWPSFREPYEPLHLFERMSTLDAAMQIRAKGFKQILDIEGSKPTPPEVITHLENIQTLDFAPVMRDINGAYDTIVRAAREPDARKRKEMFAAHNKAIREAQEADSLALAEAQVRAKPLDLQKTVSSVVIAIFVPSLDRFVTLSLRSRQEADLARVGLALVAYRAEKGAYPDALDAVSPAYLKEIPKDRFSLEPLKYRKRGNGFLLYGIGDDLKDDNGKPFTREKGGQGDFVLESEK